MSVGVYPRKSLLEGQLGSRDSVEDRKAVLSAAMVAKCLNEELLGGC